MRVLVYIIFLSLILPSLGVATPWYCVCYKEKHKGKVVEATACRSSPTACLAFQDRVKKGSRAVIAGSLLKACTYLNESHPAARLGQRSDWLPSKKKGSWWTPKGCFLNDDQYTVNFKLKEIKKQAHLNITFKNKKQVHKQSVINLHKVSDNLFEFDHLSTIKAEYVGMAVNNEKKSNTDVISMQIKHDQGDCYYEQLIVIRLVGDEVQVVYQNCAGCPEGDGSESSCEEKILKRHKLPKDIKWIQLGD